MSTGKPPSIGPRLRQPIPYVQGFGLTHPQLDVVVSNLLPYQTINRYGGDILLAIRAELRREKRDFTIVPFSIGPKHDRETRYLYIIDVIPSWDGERPILPVSQDTALKFFKAFGGDEWLQELETYCIRWPKYLSEPEWLQPRLWQSVKILGDWVKQHMTPEEIEAANQEPVAETEAELKTLKLVRSQSADMDTIPPHTPPISDQIISLGTNAALATQGAKSSAVAQAPSSSEAPPGPSAPTSSRPTLLVTSTDTEVVTTTRRKRKASPPEPIQPMTRPKRACTMKK